MENSKLWHLYTRGDATTLLFRNDSDYASAMNTVCLCAHEFSDIRIITFAIMSNHFHFMLSGDYERINCFFSRLRHKLIICSADPVVKEAFRNIIFFIKQIDDMQMARNVLVYINRNGYVVNKMCTPFSYKWGCGAFYFANLYGEFRTLLTVRAEDIKKMFRSRNPHLPEDYLLHEGYILPISYCDIKFGMSLFRDAHQYFSYLTKNVESFSELSEEEGETLSLTDSEAYAAAVRIAHEKYQSPLKELQKGQLFEIAKTLHYSYRSTNEQIRRVLRLTRYEVDSRFPLSAK